MLPLNYTKPQTILIITLHLPSITYKKTITWFGKLQIINTLFGLFSASDSGSTPIRSACYIVRPGFQSPHYEIVKCLVKAGADLSKSNHYGGTCLINSVQMNKECDRKCFQSVLSSIKSMKNIEQATTTGPLIGCSGRGYC